MKLRERFDIELLHGGPFWTTLLVLFTFIAGGATYLLFITDESKSVIGVVESLSMGTSSIYSMSPVVALIKLPNGETRSISLPLGKKVEIGDRVTLNQSNYLLSDGRVYAYDQFQK